MLASIDQQAVKQKVIKVTGDNSTNFSNHSGSQSPRKAPPALAPIQAQRIQKQHSKEIESPFNKKVASIKEIKTQRNITENSLNHRGSPRRRTYKRPQSPFSNYSNNSTEKSANNTPIMKKISGSKLNNNYFNSNNNISNNNNYNPSTNNIFSSYFDQRNADNFFDEVRKIPNYSKIQREMNDFDIQTLMSMQQLFNQEFNFDVDKIGEEKEKYIGMIFQRFDKILEYLMNKLEQKEKYIQQILGEQQVIVKEKLSVEGLRQKVENYKLQNLQLIQTMNFVQLEKKGLLIKQNQEIHNLLQEIQEQLLEQEQYSQINSKYSQLVEKYQEQALQSQQKIFEMEQQITDISFNIDNQLESNNKAINLYNRALANIWIPKELIETLFNSLDQVYEAFIKRSQYDILYLDSNESQIPMQEKLNKYIKVLNEKSEQKMSQRDKFDSYVPL